jgi:ribosomal protein S18 acetylase RimI-like enzyme
MYGPPNGLFLLARHRGELAGGVGSRMLEPEVCEMKRLFVYDRFKRKGIGRDLCAALIQKATSLGYEKMRLDTLGRMKAAIRLYENLGFREIGPYRFNPDPSTRYMELNLVNSAVHASKSDRNSTTIHSGRQRPRHPDSI